MDGAPGTILAKLWRRASFMDGIHGDINTKTLTKNRVTVLLSSIDLKKTISLNK